MNLKPHCTTRDLAWKQKEVKCFQPIDRSLTQIDVHVWLWLTFLVAVMKRLDSKKHMKTVFIWLTVHHDGEGILGGAWCSLSCCTHGKERARNKCCNLTHILLLFSRGPQPMDWCRSYGGKTDPQRITIPWETLSQTHPNVCLLGDSKASQVEN